MAMCWKAIAISGGLTLALLLLYYRMAKNNPKATLFWSILAQFICGGLLGYISWAFRSHNLKGSSSYQYNYFFALASWILTLMLLLYAFTNRKALSHVPSRPRFNPSQTLSHPLNPVLLLVCILGLFAQAFITTLYILCLGSAYQDEGELMASIEYSPSIQPLTILYSLSFVWILKMLLNVLKLVTTASVAVNQMINEEADTQGRAKAVSKELGIKLVLQCHLGSAALLAFVELLWPVVMVGR